MRNTVLGKRSRCNPPYNAFATLERRRTRRMLVATPLNTQHRAHRSDQEEGKQLEDKQDVG